MKRLTVLFLSLLCCTLFTFADSVVEDGVYSISCQQTDGYVALGSYHSVNPYIFYVQRIKIQRGLTAYLVEYRYIGYY